MVRISIVASLCFAFVVISVASEESARKPRKQHFDILLINSKEYSADHGTNNMQFLTPQEIVSNDGFSGRTLTAYGCSGGKILDGQRPLGGGTDTKTFDYPTSVTETLSYPNTQPSTNGGPIISYFEIFSTETIRSCTIISGGIGQNKITIAVDIEPTTYFKITATLYGYGY